MNKSWIFYNISFVHAFNFFGSLKLLFICARTNNFSICVHDKATEGESGAADAVIKLLKQFIMPVQTSLRHDWCVFGYEVLIQVNLYCSIIAFSVCARVGREVLVIALHYSNGITHKHTSVCLRALGWFVSAQTISRTERVSQSLSFPRADCRG